MREEKNFLSKVPILASLASHTRMIGVLRWNVPHVIRRVKLCLHAKISGLVTPFFFLTKFIILLYFGVEKGVWPYKNTFDVQLVTPIQKIYGFVLTATVNR